MKISDKKKNKKNKTEYHKSIGNIYLPEVVNLAIDEGLVLSLDIINVLDVTGVKVLLHHEAQEAVVWSVCYNSKKHK